MYLKRIYVKNWRGITELGVTFKDGLNIVCGPNESGKSSLREALRCAFVAPSRSRGKSVASSARPWNSKLFPEVVVDFFHQGVEWRLHKVFFADGSTLIRDGKMIATEDEVQKVLDESLSDFSALWSIQGDNKLAQVPASMHPVLAASEAVSPGLAWLETQISSLVDKFWTTSRLDPKTNVQDARMRTQQSKDEVNRIQRQLDGLNQVSSAIEELEEKQLAAEAAVKVLEQELQQTRGLAADWEAYKRNQAECQTLEHEQTVLVGWLTRWDRAREQHKSLLQQTSEFGKNQELAFSEMGPEPDRRLVEALSARLNYAQALLQQKRRGELDELRAPGADDLACLAALKHELALAVEALERLSKLESLAKEQQELEVRLQSDQSKVEQQSQSLNVLQAEFEAQEDSGMAERQALEMELARANEKLAQWTKLRSQFLDLSAEVSDYQVNLKGCQEQMGEEPVRLAIEEMQSRLAYAKFRYRELLSQELAGLNAPEPEQLSRLRQLTEREDLVAQGLDTLQKIQALQVEEERYRIELVQLETLATHQQDVLESEAQRTTEKEAKQRELGLLEDRRSRWAMQQNKFLELAAQSQQYQEQLAKHQNLVGPQPDRNQIEALQAQANYCQCRLRYLVGLELQALKSPDPAQLEQLEVLERQIETSPVSTTPSAPVSTLGALAVGVFLLVLLALLAAGRSQGESAGLASVAGLAAALIGYARLGNRSKPVADASEARRQRDQLLHSLGVDSLSAARQIQATILELKAQLGDEDIPTLEVLRQLGGNCLNLEELDLLSKESLRSRIKETASKIGEEESRWKQAQHNHGERREEYERLLQDNPEKRLLSEFEHLRSLSKEDTQVASQLPDSPELDGWAARLSDGCILKSLDERILKLRQEIDAISIADHTSQKENLISARRKLEVARTSYLQTQGKLQPLQELLDQQTKQAHVTEQGQLESAALTVKADLADLSRELNVDSLQDAEERAEKARELQTRLGLDGVEGIVVADSPAAERYRQLKGEELLVEIGSLEAQIVQADQDWKTRRERFVVLRNELETLQKCNPEPKQALQLQQIDEFLNEITEIYPELSATPRPDLADCISENEPGALLGAVIDRLNNQLEQALNAGSIELRTNLDDAEKCLDQARQEAQETLLSLQRATGVAEAKREEFNRLIRSGVKLPELETIDDHQHLNVYLQNAQRFNTQLQTQFADTLCELGVETLEEAQERQSKATAIRAQLEDALPPNELELLREAALDAESLESLSVLALNQEVQNLPERIQSADAEWQAARQTWTQRQQQYQKLLQQNPQQLLQASLENFRTLLKEQPLAEIQLPAELSMDWNDEMLLDKAATPVSDVIRDKTKELQSRLAGLAAPQLPEEEVATAVAQAELAVKKEQARRNELQAQVQQHLGSLTSQGEVYSLLGRAQEAHSKALQAQKELELEAESVKLLKSTLETAKAEIEADIVGPLRELMNSRLTQLTTGRYRGIKLEQNFQADVLLTSTRTEAPLQDVSFGTHEQVVFLSRVCLAELLSREERHLLVFDDNLVHTDAARIDLACQILNEVAEKAQIIMMTCHPERFSTHLPQALVHQMVMA